MNRAVKNRAEVGGRMIRVRVIAVTEEVDEVAKGFVESLEKSGHMILEWTMPKPRRAPELGKSAIYVTAVKPTKKGSL
jgi:hypothetical protein